jgi:hypothetical protein
MNNQADSRQQTGSQVTSSLSPLSPQEARRLDELERIIGRGMPTFLEVGSALFEIRESALYRASHQSFNAYCRERWEMSRSNAYRLIGAAQTTKQIACQKVSPAGDNSCPDSEPDPVIPPNEWMARPLSRLPETERAAAWQEAVRETGGKPTQQDVVRAVNRRMGPGQTLVNGKLQADPPDIAKQRAAGTIGGIPVATIPTKEEQEAEAAERERQEEREAIQEAEQTDEQWLKTLPLSSLLQGVPLKTFQEDALNWRLLQQEQKRFKRFVAERTNKTRRMGRWLGQLRRALSAEPPEKWLCCPDKTNGGCGGSGQTMIGKCSHCRGDGYWVPGIRHKPAPRLDMAAASTNGQEWVDIAF